MKILRDVFFIFIFILIDPMPFNLNIYSVLLLMGFLQGSIYALLLLYRSFREDSLSDKLLAFLLVLICLHIAQYMLGFAGWYDSKDSYSTFMFYFPFHQVLLAGPVFYFYFKSLTNDAFQFRQKDAWHFLPALVHLGLFVGIFLIDIVYKKWIGGHTLVDHFGTQGAWASFRQGTLDYLIHKLGTISFVVYLVLTAILYRQYREYINNHYSVTEAIQFNWIRTILYVMMSAFIFDFMVDITGHFIEYTDYTSKWRGYFGFAILIYALSILGYNRSTPITKQLDFDPNKQEATNDTKPHFPELVSYKSRLLILMEQESLYLQSDLTLKEVATHLNTNTSLLSKVINTGFGQNFNDFINSFRVEAVKNKMTAGDSQHLTLTAIAFECGFNSKATFNRAFKKLAGMSPREYMQGLKD